MLLIDLLLYSTLAAMGITGAYAVKRKTRRIPSETQQDIVNTLQCTYIRPTGEIVNISERQAALVDALLGDVMVRNSDNNMWEYDGYKWVHRPDMIYANGTVYKGFPEGTIVPDNIPAPKDMPEPPKPKVKRNPKEIIHVHRSPGDERITLTLSSGKKVQIDATEFLHSGNPAQLIEEQLGEAVEINRGDTAYRILSSDGTWYDLRWEGPYLSEEEYQKMLIPEDLPKVDPTGGPNLTYDSETGLWVSADTPEVEVEVEEKPKFVPSLESAFWEYGEILKEEGCWAYMQSKEDSNYYNPIELDYPTRAKLITPVKGERLIDFNSRFYADCVEEDGVWLVTRRVLASTDMYSRGGKGIGCDRWFHYYKQGGEYARCNYTKIEVKVW